jgi:hypothetical protein
VQRWEWLQKKIRPEERDWSNRIGGIPGGVKNVGIVCSWDREVSNGESGVGGRNVVAKVEERAL